ncbi:hypothetical protein A165_16220 [Vibrio tasmaniensis ZS-17]|uniref:hypothetical protein n=1 Tax=Vibrio tasmaniensis TaxID=212663 RepID=UPI000381624B|nr:hypothetical protein [Vibrio tasmaniensis]OED61027.1 hypothetical protein A165_16220 [Vibrio tasmaniensis ZS-17]
MSINKVPSKNFQLLGVASTTILLAFLTALFVSLMLSKKEDFALLQLQFTIFGTTLSYLSAVIAAYAILTKRSYDKRLHELDVQDKIQVLQTQFAKQESFTEEEIKAHQKTLEEEQESIYKECHNIFAFDATCNAHILLSIALISLGGAFQIAGAI